MRTAVTGAELCAVEVAELHQDTGALGELHEAEMERRIGAVVEPVGGDRDDLRRRVGETDILEDLGAVGTGADGDAALGNCTLPRASRPPTNPIMSRP